MIRAATIAVLTLTGLLMAPMPQKAIHSAHGQVFDVQVEVNKSALGGSDVVDDADQLGPLIREYMENTQWTDDRFEPHERIQVNMQVILNAVEDREFRATLVISSRRPIYNSMQVTQLLLHNDRNWRFELDRNHTLRHDENRFDEIASMLDYYAYLILGIDYDTFSELGGTRFYRRAQSIVDLAQGQGGTGWSASGSERNRYQLVNLLLDPGFEPLREAYYLYHRHGLDRFTTDTEQAWQNGLEALEKIHQARQQTTRNYPFDLIFNSKYREFTAFFMEADQQVRNQAYRLLTGMDQSHRSEYEKLQ